MGRKIERKKETGPYIFKQHLSQTPVLHSLGGVESFPMSLLLLGFTDCAGRRALTSEA